MANRPTGFRHTLGFFVNALPFRINLDPLTGFNRLLQEVKASCARALAHQHIPFDSIVSAVDAPRNPAVGSPLFNILLNLHTAEVQGDRENPPKNLHTVRLVPHVCHPLHFFLLISLKCSFLISPCYTSISRLMLNNYYNSIISLQYFLF